MRPRSAAAIRLHAGKALCAAVTALSMSAGPASATSAIVELSCGLSVASVSPDSASTKRPSMKSWCRIGVRKPAAACRSARFMSACSELDRDLGRLALLDLVDQGRRAVLPDQQHRALRAVALVPTVRGHGRHVAGLHDDA